jgi:FMN reductase
LLAEWVGAKLAGDGFQVTSLSVCELPAAELLGCRANVPSLQVAVSLVEQAQGVVLVTPVYKASYSGALKVFLDMLPQHALEGKVVFPMAVGGSLAHLLAIDYGLRPVLVSMNALHVVSGVFVLDQFLERTQQGCLKVGQEIAKRLETAIRAFTHSIIRHNGHFPVAPAGNGKRESLAGQLGTYFQQNHGGNGEVPHGGLVADHRPQAEPIGYSRRDL